MSRYIRCTPMQLFWLCFAAFPPSVFIWAMLGEVSGVTLLVLAALFLGTRFVLCVVMWIVKTNLGEPTIWQSPSL